MKASFNLSAGNCVWNCGLYPDELGWQSKFLISVTCPVGAVLSDKCWASDGKFDGDGSEKAGNGIDRVVENSNSFLTFEGELRRGFFGGGSKVFLLTSRLPAPRELSKISLKSKILLKHKKR